MYDTEAMLENLTGVTSFSLISPWWHRTVSKGGSSPFSLRVENVFNWLKMFPGMKKFAFKQRNNLQNNVSFDHSDMWTNPSVPA